MFCFVGLIIFAILGIFSATHRALAKEAVACVFRRITFRSCHVGFKEKFKGIILSRLIRRSASLARIFNRHFELFAWIFVILSIISIIWVGRGVYNFYIYGSCNGLNRSGFCVFDPTGESNKLSSYNNVCSVEAPSEANLTIKPLNLAEFPNQGVESQNQIVFIGCYSCDYTRKVYPIVKKLLLDYKVNYTFIHFPVKSETTYLSVYGACIFKEDKSKFWEFNDLLFSLNKDHIKDNNYIDSLVKGLGLDLKNLKKCIQDKKTQDKASSQFEDIKQTGIYGTPTIFINNKVFVGPKSYRVYKRALNK